MSNTYRAHQGSKEIRRRAQKLALATIKRKLLDAGVDPRAQGALLNLARKKIAAGEDAITPDEVRSVVEGIAAGRP